MTGQLGAGGGYPAVVGLVAVPTVVKERKFLMGAERVGCSKGWNVPKTCINWRLERRNHSCRQPAIICTGPHPKKPKVGRSNSLPFLRLPISCSEKSRLFSSQALLTSRAHLPSPPLPWYPQSTNYSSQNSKVAKLVACGMFV